MATDKKRVLRRWLLPALILIIWQLAGSFGLLDPMVLPAPVEVLQECARMALSGELFVHLGTSSYRVLVGFAVATFAGCIVGLLVAKSSLLQRLFDPSMQALRLTPVVAAAPLLILWFGFGEASKIAIIAAMALFPMYLAALAAVRAIDPQLQEVVRVLQPSMIWTLKNFYLPAAIPSLLSGARYSMMIAWLSLAVAELIGTDRGIGHLVLAGNAHKNLSLLFVGVLLFAIAGKIADGLLVLFERRATAWADTHLSPQQ